MTIGGPFPENTDLNDIPPEWIDPATAQFAGEAQAAADAGADYEDTDGDGVTDAGEFVADTDPLNPLDHRSLGRTEDDDPNFRDYIDDGDVALGDSVETEQVVYLEPVVNDGFDDIVA